MTDSVTYKVEEIFHDNPDNPEEVIMTIPPEIMERMGWKEGDVIRVENTELGMTISKVEKGE